MISSHSLGWLPTITPSPRSAKTAPFPVSSSIPSYSCVSTRLVVSRTQSLGLRSTGECQWMCWNKNPTSVVAKSISDDQEITAVEVVESAAENGETLENGKTVDTDADEKPPRKPLVKLGDIMGILNKRAVEASEMERPVPDIRTGDIVEIKLEVPENRRRLSIYKGIVMSRQNAGIHTTIRIRRIIAGIGVEIVFPLYSPNIKEIKVVKHRKVRRARLYYLRDKLPRLSTFK